jgi:hypothetical protein
MKSSQRDSALAGHDSVESLAGLGEDAENVVHLTDAERHTPRPRPHTLEAASIV